MNQMKKNVVLLAICQALMMTGNALLIATSALVGLTLADDKSLATVPLGLQYLATMLFTLPASLLMKHAGRRAGFILGAVVGMTGGFLTTYGILAKSFMTFGVGSFLIGMFNGFAQYYRFAAADTATHDYRSKAISLVLAGGVIAAFAGPNLANLTRDLFDSVIFAGSYASLIALYAGSALVLLFVRIPRPSAAERQHSGRPLQIIVGQPSFLVAVLGAMVAYGVMNLVMTATPLAMRGYGHAFSDTVLVIQWHMLGMFAPSFFTGHLINRYGALNIMLVGAVLMGLCLAANLSGSTVWHFWCGLLLLGVGWNFLFIGATTLLTDVYNASERAKVQGINDLLVFGTVTLSATTSGLLHYSLGWAVVNVGVMPLLLLCLFMTYRLRVRRLAEAEGL
ncbi:MAG: MFS transporter [Acidiferrobacterales bacterium]